MAKYRKKPIVIEATQWYGFDQGPQNLGIHGRADNGTGWMDTLEGGHIITPGDWVITGISGEKYPCKPDIFKATYDLVGESE